MTEEQDQAVQVIIRKANLDTDAPFIYASWRNSLWNDERRPPNEGKEFFSKATHAIRDLLNNHETKTTIAVLKDDTDFILGFSVITDRNLDWVYVKKDYRMRGVAKLLCGANQQIPAFDTIASPQTKIGKALAKMKNLKIKENKANGPTDRPKSSGPISATKETR